MLYMVIERFKDGDAKAVYRRFRERGRMAPEGLAYLDSWVEEGRGRCFQLMAEVVAVDETDRFQGHPGALAHREPGDGQGARPPGKR